MRIIRVEHGGTSYYGILEDGLVFRLHQQDHIFLVRYRCGVMPYAFLNNV